MQEQGKGLKQHEKIRHTTQFLAELFPHHIFGALSSFSKALSAEAKILRTCSTLEKAKLIEQAPATALVLELNKLTGIKEMTDLHKLAEEADKVSYQEQ